MKQTKIIVFLTFIYTILGQPFLFMWLHFGGKQFSLKLIVLFILGILTLKKNYHYPKNVTSIFYVITILYLMSGIYNFELFMPTLFLYFDIVYFYFIFINFINNHCFRDLLYKFDFYIVHIVACSCIIAFFAYLYMPGLFLTLDVADYPVFYNRFVGMISAWGIRTCWYFAEPSYCGFFLGMHLILFLSRKYNSLIQKILSLIIIIGGLLVTASMGSAIYVTLSVLIYIAVRFRINKKLIITSLYISLVIAVVILPFFNAHNINQDVVNLQQSSFDDRQERMLLSSKIYKDMTIIDYLLGSGVEFAAVKYKYGLSDVYNKLLCEHGIIYMILFLLIVRKLMKDEIPTYSYVLLSYLSVIIHATPILMIAYLSTLYQTKLIKCNQSYVWNQI